MHVYEVFQQQKEGGALVHSGNIQAPDDDLAIHYARELYGRRGESVRLWVVPRDHVLELTDPDLLKPPFDRSYRRPDGYNVVPKLRAVKARVAAASEKEVTA